MSGVAVSVSELAARCSALYTAAISDILDGRGLLEQTLPPGLLPLQAGMRLAGPVYPIKGRPAPGADYDTCLRKVLAMLGTVPAGHVCVYETDDREEAEEKAATESAIRDAVRAGTPPLDAYERYGTF